MKSFDEFYWKHNDCINKDTSLAHSFGEKVWNHKQAEIDELKREMLNKANEAYADGQKSMRKMIKSNEDELRKRIDEAMKYVSESPLKDVSRRAMINFMDILKGDSHES